MLKKQFKHIATHIFDLVGSNLTKQLLLKPILKLNLPFKVIRLERRSVTNGATGTRLQSARSSSIDSTDEDSKFDDPSLRINIAPVSPTEPPKTNFSDLGAKDANMNQINA